MLSLAELLMPRFKVINTYPNSKNALGNILIADGEDSYLLYSSYPNIFRKMKWWENRKESDMPEYIKEVLTRTTYTTAKYFKIKKWNTERAKGITENGIEIFLASGNYIPTFDFEYEKYVKQ
jgi:hypothetical protein